eukprot:CAMPEP_0203675228 /NCGR_PEP_ID=MMETSP0090-20130426/19602_1 /ASSEMBLY_ACC=CAM_ASM_001088 /TAXON_ID=426623 /ORGANISM="Chaetoceros affinis, Strain CCMP159" /LENGTH=693 /DNA_ID=CAMNT_0050541355 /DNA_START=232 /DNA_END=2313 /DNA_ORIENTATION=-
MDEIQSGKHDNELKDILSLTGLFAIRVPLHHEDIFHNDHGNGSSGNDDNDDTTNNLLGNLCRCPPQNMAQIPNGDSRTLSDGTTTRSTIATATRGFLESIPLSLSQTSIDQYCNSNEYTDSSSSSSSRNISVYESLEKVRDYVALASRDVFVPALDRLIQQAAGAATTKTAVSYSALNSFTSTSDSSNSPPTPTLLTAKNDKKEYKTISSILNDANHLEHFHLYSKSTREEMTTYNYSHVSASAVDDALNWHTDGGLFLAFVPGTSCHDGAVDDSFHIAVPSDIVTATQTETETESRAVFPRSTKYEITVAIMLGAGAEHWLNNTPESLKLRATKHAVKMKGGDVRAWYGMMHLVPSQAIIQKHPVPRTFAEMKKSSVHSASRKFGDDHSSSENGVVIGCGTENVSQETIDNNNRIDISSESLSKRKRRRLQHVGNQGDCDGSGGYFCWLSCLSPPKNDDKSIEDHFEDNKSLYCLDPYILGTTGNLTLAVNECNEPVTGRAGGVMNEACGNYWHQTTEGVQSYLTPGDEQSKSKGEKYCYGSTAMYMQGFEWEGTTCVVFLFTSWVISTRAAMFGACIGAILLAILTEIVTRHRRSLLNRITRPRMKVFSSAFLYAIQVSLGYAVMLLIMTYSGPLVLSVILGLSSGHLIINWDARKADNIKLEGTTPCCNYFDEDESTGTTESRTKHVAQP